jgi:hypothetical protein
MTTPPSGPLPSPDDTPEFSVVVDAAQRLVLQVGKSRWIIAAVLFAVGAIPGLGWWLEPSLWFLVVPAVAFWAGAVFFALARKRWTFDAERGTVRFDSLLWGAWEARLGAVTDLRLESRTHGPAGEQITQTALMMTVDGRRKPARVNASTDGLFIRELKQRIEAMVEPWRRFGTVPRNTP